MSCSAVIKREYCNGPGDKLQPRVVYPTPQIKGCHDMPQQRSTNPQGITSLQKRNHGYYTAVVIGCIHCSAGSSSIAIVTRKETSFQKTKAFNERC